MNQNMQNLYEKALKIASESNRASISLMQRELNIGYNRAAKLLERMELEGIVSEPTESGRRIFYGLKPVDYD